MTYKHVKFEDSVVMRSLEKVAQEKGLVKPEPLTKTAAAKTDLTPSNSLLDNVLKLCAGLRDRGFDKQANELEVNLLNYKKAEATLYEAFPEKGEDLIYSAHPKGSHKLEGVDAQDDGAVVEDILDQHAKSVQMIEKKPTGKLASTLEAIEAVKVALGAPPLVVRRAAKVSLGVPVMFDPGVGYGYAPSLWGKVVNMFPNNTGSTIPLAGEEVGATVTGVAAGTAATIAAGVLSGVVGLVIGYEIFENRFYVNDLKEAGQNLSSQLEGVSHDMSDAQSNEQQEFEASLNKALASAGKGYALLQDAKPENLEALNDYTNNLQDASQNVYGLMTWAREKWNPSKLQPGQSGSDHWYDRLTGIFSSFRAVEISASNFINVAQKAIAAARLAISKILESIQETASKYLGPSAPTTSGATTSPLNRLSVLLSKLNGYKSNTYVSSHPAGLTYVNTEIQEIQTLVNQIKNIPVDQLTALTATIEQKVAEKEKEVNDFNTNWVQGR